MAFYFVKVGQTNPRLSYEVRAKTGFPKIIKIQVKSMVFGFLPLREMKPKGIGLGILVVFGGPTISDWHGSRRIACQWPIISPVVLCKSMVLGDPSVSDVVTW